MSNPRVRASWTPVQMPPYSQDRNWKVFCYGLEEKEEEEGEEVNTSATGDSKDGNKRKRKRGYGENGEGYYPEYYILGQIDQVRRTTDLGLNHDFSSITRLL